MSRTFALEIGTEEIPAGYLPPASAQLKAALEEGLKERRIEFARVDTFAAPRRLIALVHGIGDRQADLDKEVMGPPAKVAFGPDGALTKAGEGFAKKQGVPVSALRRVETAGGEYLVATVHETGRPLEAVLLEWLPGLITALSFPKTMKWRGDEFRFARPVRSILALLDAEVLPLVVGPLKAGRVTRGHRLFVNAPVEVATAADLLPALEKAGVLADPAVRTTRIAAEVARAAGEAKGRAVEDAGLTEEVAYLVEYPTAVLGSFDTEFLALPREVIVTAMRSHQRYFGVEDAQGNLLPNFITLATAAGTTLSRSWRATSACCAPAWPTRSSTGTWT
jgi:glycyl-tRNA synthetase beta chain